MITLLNTDGIQFSDKRNKTLLKKMITAVDEGATYQDLSNILRGHNTSKAKLPFDIARILTFLKGRSIEILEVIDRLNKDARLVNMIGDVMLQYVKDTLDEEESMEDDTIKIHWKLDRKIIVSDKRAKQKETEKKTAKKTKRGK